VLDDRRGGATVQGVTTERRDAADVPDGLRAHWRAWLGATDDELTVLGSVTNHGGSRIVVVGSAGRTVPGWDGEVHAVTGVVDADGAAVVSLPPEHVEWARELVAHGADVARLRAALPAPMRLPDHVVYQGVCRWSARPEDVPSTDEVPEAGQWLPVDDDRVPEWLVPFGGDALVALDDDDRYLAGVGLKRHDRHGHEIAVGTDERARGRGLARRLVAQAARSLHAEGIVPTYLHDPANTASARVADACGLPDRGWWALGMARIPS
jgi:RimJ/RimL family protein N-acetyltransferase